MAIIQLILFFVVTTLSNFCWNLHVLREGPRRLKFLRGGDGQTGALAGRRTWVAKFVRHPFRLKYGRPEERGQHEMLIYYI